MILKIVGLVLVVLLVGVFIFAKSKGVSPISWKLHNAISQQQEIALAGFDPVSYFDAGKATKGNPATAFRWKDVNWHFSNQESLEKFKANAKDYLPSFGGYCAFAVSKGFTATANPEVWHVQDGALYLFADEGVKSQWLTDLPNSLKLSEKKWRP